MQEREAAGVLRDTAAIRTPFYVVDETLLKKNLEILKDTAERAGCRILLAQKAFSMYSVYPLIRQYLSGTDLEKRSLAGRPMCFLPPTARMSLMRF